MTVKRMLCSILESPALPGRVRTRALCALGLAIGPVGMESGVRIWNTNIRIGAGSFVNRGVVFEGKARITLGEKVALGPQVLVLTSTHDVGRTDWRAGGGQPRYDPVTIGAGSWIGARTVILPGVSIGEGCVIGAGAVVRKDCPPNTMWAGVPARFKQHLP